MPSSIVPSTLAAYRLRKGWSHNRLWKESGVGVSTIKRIEKSRTVYRGCSNVPEKLAVALGVTVDDLSLEVGDHEVLVADGPFVEIEFLYFRIEEREGRSVRTFIGRNLAEPPEDAEVVAAPIVNPAGTKGLPPVQWQRRTSATELGNDNSGFAQRLRERLARHREER